MPRAVFTVLFGAAGSLLAASIATLELKYVVAFVALVPLAMVAMSTGTSERLQKLLLACLPLSIPLSLGLNFLFREHLGAAPSISLNSATFCVLALLGVWIYRYNSGAVRPVFVSERTMVWATLTYMAVGILSLLNAQDAELVFLEEIRLAILFATMLVIMNLRREDQLRTFVFFITVASFIEGALATAQYVTHSTLVPHALGAERELVRLDIGDVATRPTGTLGHPNVLGYYLESTLPLSLALLLVEQRARFRLWYLVAFLAALAGILVSLSRGAWFSVPVSCGFTLWILYRKRVFRLNSAILIGFVGAVLVVFTYFALPTIVKRFSHYDYASASTRMPLNYAALSIIPQFPLLGVGLNNFAESFRDYDRTGYSQRFTWKIATPYSVSSKPAKIVVHNMLLWVWVEVGTLGLAAFLWIFVAAFRVARKAWRNANEWSRGVLVGCVAGMLGHLVHGQMDPGFRVSPSVSMLFYAMFGLIGAIWLQQQRVAQAAAPAHSSTGSPAPAALPATGDSWRRPPPRPVAPGISFRQARNRR